MTTSVEVHPLFRDLLKITKAGGLTPARVRALKEICRIASESEYFRIVPARIARDLRIDSLDADLVLRWFVSSGLVIEVSDGKAGVCYQITEKVRA